MLSTSSSPVFIQPLDTRLHLPVTHTALCAQAEMLLHGYADAAVGSISAYFAGRAQHEAAVKQDLLPLLVYEALGAKEQDRVMPLVTAWALHLAAAHLVDSAQDQGRMESVHHSLLALGAAGVAMAGLDVVEDTLRDLLEAMGQVAMLAAEAQREEWKRGGVWNKEAYFRAIAGKSAAIIAAGAWLGGRLVTSEAAILDALQEFGLALGMAIQISDDCLDLVEDLQNGTHTLPVIEGLALKEHKSHAALVQLVNQPRLSSAEAQHAADILTDMGVMLSCQRVIRAYQVQAAAAFVPFPGLEVYFYNYVTASEH